MRTNQRTLLAIAERAMKPFATAEEKDVAKYVGCRNSRPLTKKLRYRSSNPPPRKHRSSGGKGGSGGTGDAKLVDASRQPRHRVG